MVVFTSAMLVLVLVLVLVLRLMLILRRTLPSSFDPSIHLAIPRAPHHLRALCLFLDAHSHPSIGGHNSCTYCTEQLVRIPPPEKVASPFPLPSSAIRSVHPCRSFT
ncbi:hypothetical protein EDB80DRAFT_679245 [Ilyonectria destructans]|nr:hypothetical protein EDB80DRAFT_679245 [Ilyonectria destructans]